MPDPLAALRRDAFWEVYDCVPHEQHSAGCEYCQLGWASGPGLVYRCGNCNPEVAGQPDTYTTLRVTPASVTLWQKLKDWFRG